jgi:Ca2+-binding EF-hand superfamily protein
MIQIFKEIDIDNTGYLDEHKIKKDISIIIFLIPNKKIKAIFKEMDVNKSGKVDIEHFIAWMDKDIRILTEGFSAKYCLCSHSS